MKTSSKLATAGMTVWEMSIGTLIMSFVAMVSYAILNNSTLLLAKNVTVNSTNTVVRGSLDRINFEVSQANGMPTLINSNGSAASSTGPAAGIVYDSYLGGPYLVTNPGVNGLITGTTTFQMTIATDAVALPSIPQANDVVCFTASNLRPLVSTCSPAALIGTPPAHQTLTISLKAPLSGPIAWTSPIEERAFLIHRKAIVVVPTNGLNQLRIYNNVETTTNNCDLTTSYAVLSQDIGTQTGDNTPFSIVTQNGNSFLSVAMRVDNQQYNNSLATHQSRQFNTFLRVDTLVRPRNFLDL